MARLGELLVETKLLTAEQVEHGLRAQVMWGGRLGTNLIELGYLDLDQLSSALGKLLRMPAALARHFEKADPALQLQLSTEFADRYSVVPLMKVPNGKVVIASLGVIEARGLAIVADELGVDPAQLVPSVAAELRIRYHLERAYKIPRGARFLRSRGKTIPPFPQFEADALAFEDSAVTSVPAEQREQLREMHAEAVAAPSPIPQVADAPVAIPETDDTTTRTEVPPDLIAPAVADKPSSSPGLTLDALAPGHDGDDLDVPLDEGEEQRGRDRRKYVRVITDEPPSTDSERAKLGRIAIRKVAVTTAPTNLTLGEATRAIRRSTDRDKVVDLVLVMLEKFMPALDAAVLLVLRGDVAIGWKGYCRGGSAIPEVAIPLDKPGLIPTAIQRCLSVRSPSLELGEIDRLLLHSLRCNHDDANRDLVVVPVTIAAQALLTLAIVAPQNCEIATAESIAAATGAAFARLMRDASR